MSRLLLVRHGESTWNAAGRWQGQADPPLSRRGERQAAAAVAAVPGGYEEIVASDLRRAHRTAELLAAGLDLPLRVDPRLRERTLGPWQGLTRAEIEDGWPGMLADGRRPDGYEPDDRLADRALAALRELTVATIVVTHGGLIRAVEGSIGIPVARMPNLAARELRVRGTGFDAGARVELVPDGDVAAEAGG